MRFAMSSLKATHHRLNRPSLLHEPNFFLLQVHELIMQMTEHKSKALSAEAEKESMNVRLRYANKEHTFSYKEHIFSNKDKFFRCACACATQIRNTFFLLLSFSSPLFPLRAWPLYTNTDFPLPQKISQKSCCALPTSSDERAGTPFLRGTEPS